jgi:hypothetical protein
MDVLGHGENITRALMLALAEKASLSPSWADSAVQRMLDVHARFKQVINETGMQKNICPSTLKILQAAIDENAKRLG